MVCKCKQAQHQILSVVPGWVPVQVSKSMRRGMISMCATIAAFAIGLLMMAKGLHSPLSWLPSGVAVALTLRWGRAQLPWIALGALLIGLLGRHPPFALPMGVVSLLSGPWLMAWWLDRAGFRRDFARREDVVSFVLATAVSMLLPPTLTLGAMRAFGSADDALDAPVAHLMQWWMNGTIAVMLLAPAVIAAHAGMAREWRRSCSGAIMLVIATAAFCIAMVTVPVAARGAWLSPIGVLIVVVSAMRMDVTFTGLLAVAMTASVELAGLQAVGTQLPGTGSARAWAFTMVLAGITLILRALLAERDALDERLRESESRYRQGLLEAAAREQERIGRDVHDSLGQELTAISLMARSLETRARAASLELGDDAHEIVGAARLAMESARSIARGLLPTIDGGDDLARALQALGERIATASGMRVTVRVLPGLQVPGEQARNLYRIAQEALNNALKHSRARHVDLHLATWSPQMSATAGAGIRMTISDDGIGLDEARALQGASHGLGQRTMQYRAAVAGGEVRFESAPDAGTRVICDVPLTDSTLADSTLADPTQAHAPQARAARAAAALAVFEAEPAAEGLDASPRAA